MTGRPPARRKLLNCLFLDTLERLLLDIGLVIARNKTKAVPACSSVQNFKGCCWIPDGNFKSSGSKHWCEALPDRRVCKARTLLEAIGRYHDSQGAFALLRSCTGWAKVLYSCRTVPPLQAAGLCNADRDIHHSLGRLVGSPLSDEAWLPVDLAPAMQLNTLQHLMFPAWPSPKNWVPAFDLVSTSMLSTVVSYEPTRSPP